MFLDLFLLLCATLCIQISKLNASKFIIPGYETQILPYLISDVDPSKNLTLSITCPQVNSTLSSVCDSKYYGTPNELTAVLDKKTSFADASIKGYLFIQISVKDEITGEEKLARNRVEVADQILFDITNFSINSKSENPFRVATIKAPFDELPLQIKWLNKTESDNASKFKNFIEIDVNDFSVDRSISFALIDNVSGIESEPVTIEIEKIKRRRFYAFWVVLIIAGILTLAASIFVSLMFLIKIILGYRREERFEVDRDLQVAQEAPKVDSYREESNERDREEKLEFQSNEINENKFQN